MVGDTFDGMSEKTWKEIFLRKNSIIKHKLKEKWEQ